MKTHIYILLVLIFVSQNLNVEGQDVFRVKNAEINITLPINNIEIIARDYIKLLPGDNGTIGFNFKASVQINLSVVLMNLLQSLMFH